MSLCPHPSHNAGGRISTIFGTLNSELFSLPSARATVSGFNSPSCDNVPSRRPFTFNPIPDILSIVFQQMVVRLLKQGFRRKRRLIASIVSWEADIVQLLIPDIRNLPDNSPLDNCNRFHKLQYQFSCWGHRMYLLYGDSSDALMNSSWRVSSTL